MGAGSSVSSQQYAASSTDTEEGHDGGPPMNWEAAATAANGYDRIEKDPTAAESPPTTKETAEAKVQEAKEEVDDDDDDEDGPNDLVVAHETVQMIFDILSENGSHMTDEESMQTVLQTAQALANHSQAAALLMSSQRDQKSGDTLLHGAVRVGELEVVQFLLTDQFKFDINAQNWK